MSGAKKPSARDSIAMRGPSRQITAVLMARRMNRRNGAARSAMTSPRRRRQCRRAVSGRRALAAPRRLDLQFRWRVTALLARA